MDNSRQLDAVTRSSPSLLRRLSLLAIALVVFGFVVAGSLGVFKDDRGKAVAFGETITLEGGYEITMAAPHPAPDVPGIGLGPTTRLQVVPGTTWRAEITIANTTDRPMPVSELEIYPAHRGDQPSEPAGPDYDRWRRTVIAPGDSYRDQVTFVARRSAEPMSASIRVTTEPQELFATWETGREPELW